MRINRFNSEGYVDETPYLALQRIEIRENKDNNAQQRRQPITPNKPSRVRTRVWHSQSQNSEAKHCSCKSQGNPTKYYTKTEDLSMENTKSTSQRIELIALNKIVPAGYQRGTKAEQVKKIIAKFNEAKLDALLVSEQADGTFHVIDGGHRTEALRKMGYTHAMARVLTGMTYEQEADLFARQDEDSRSLSWFDFHRAGVIAKNETWLRLEKILGDNGFQIGNGKDFKNISAVQTLLSILDEYGDQVLDETLCLIANTWSGLSKTTTREFLIGVAEFVHRYGMVNFAERMKDRFAVVCYEYAEAMKRRAFLNSTPAIVRRNFCRVLVEQYNKGLRANQKAYLKWEEK